MGKNPGGGACEESFLCSSAMVKLRRRRRPDHNGKGKLIAKVNRRKGKIINGRARADEVLSALLLPR